MTNAHILQVELEIHAFAYHCRARPPKLPAVVSCRAHMTRLRSGKKLDVMDACDNIITAGGENKLHNSEILSLDYKWESLSLSSRSVFNQRTFTFYGDQAMQQSPSKRI
jgi:hypothetical protein